MERTKKIKTGKDVELGIIKNSDEKKVQHRVGENALVRKMINKGTTKRIEGKFEDMGKEMELRILKNDIPAVKKRNFK